MCFQELFYGPYFCQVQDPRVLQLHRAHPGRPDHEADAGAGEGDRHGPHRADVRGGRADDRHLLQHRRRDRRRRLVPREVPQDAHPARQGLLGEVLLPPRATWATRSSTPRSARSASTSATTATSRRAPGRWASTGRSWSSSRRPPRAGCASTCGASSRCRTRSPTATSSGTINRVGIEPLGDDDFYGQSYFVDPRGQFVGDVAMRTTRSCIVRDLDLDMIDGGPPALAVLPRPAPGRLRRPVRPLAEARWTSGSRSSPSIRFERTVDLTQRAEANGFTYGWLFDSHVLWREPYPLLTLMAQATERLRLGHLRHEPGDARADGHRLRAGDPQRDHRRTDGPRHRPRRQRAAGDGQEADHGRRRGGRCRVIRALAAGREGDLRRHRAPAPLGDAGTGADLGRRLRTDGAGG